MDARKSRNYLQSMPGMINGMKGFFLAKSASIFDVMKICSYLHSLEPLHHLPTASEASETAALSDGVSVWPGLGVLALYENLDTETLLPRPQWRSSNRGGDSGPRASYANEDIVGLLLIKMFPHGCSIHGLIKNVIANVIKRCVMIHDNNYAARKTSAHDLRNVHDMRKSLPGFITDKTCKPQSYSQLHIRICISEVTGHLYLSISYIWGRPIPLTGWPERLMGP